MFRTNQPSSMMASRARPIWWLEFTYGSFIWTQSLNGMSCIHQCSVLEWFVTTSRMTLMPFSWAFATISRYSSLEP